ncbi:MAG: YbfB/YjiJ family MFS transporter, partial [Ramlibacter sp.]|nr:YbfB/YjiJ family MFS transporter [Ramlibacter sp.]
MNSRSARKPLSPLAVFAAGLLSLAAAMGIGRFCFTPMLPLMIGAGQLDVAGGGWVAAANYAGYLVGAITAARLGWTATRLAGIALLLTALLTASMAGVTTVPAWTAIRFAAGVCSAWAFVGTTVWCLGALARLQRPALGTTIYAGVGTGIAVSGVYCLVASSLGASATSLWIQLGVLGALFSLPAWLVLPRVDAQMLSTPLPSTPLPGEHSKVPAGLRGLLACYAIFGFGYILPATFLPVLARSVVDDPRLFGLAWPVFGTTAVVSIFVAGWFMRRASRMRVWAVSSAVMGVGVLLPSLWLSG